LTKREEQSNKSRSKVSVRVEHIFGFQSEEMGGTLVRSIRTVRAKAHIELKNLAYNMRHLVRLEHLATGNPVLCLSGGGSLNHLRHQNHREPELVFAKNHRKLGHFPSDDDATKPLYLALPIAAKYWTVLTSKWRQPLNQFSSPFHEQFPSSLY